MCGIVAYVGEKDARPFLVSGLKKLEYRGYDSSGVALLNNELRVYKEPGRIVEMEKTLDDFHSCTGIGHTRWATHGVPNKVNAHPHLSSKGRFTIVHNGTIDNYQDIKNGVLSDYTFISDTDTEVLATLLEHLHKGNIHNTITKLMEIVEGSYALVVMDNEREDELYVVKYKSPVLVGVGESENFIASDIGAMIDHTQSFFELQDFEYAIVTKNNAKFYDINRNEVFKKIYKADYCSLNQDLGDYSHYMLKEIEEQPAVLTRMLTNFRIEDELYNLLKSINKIYIIASGTSYNAGLVGKFVFETKCKLSTEVMLGSEFTTFTPILEENAIFLFLSQSGETADSRRALDLVKEMGYRTLSLTNVQTSSIARETEFTMHLNCGVEIAVASTKAYTAQIAMMSLIANSLNPVQRFREDFEHAIESIEKIISNKAEIEEIVIRDIKDQNQCFYIGRGADYFSAEEAALKLKEVSYIHSESFASGELKHGTIALIEDKTPVIALLTNPKGTLTRGNVKEVEARKATTIVISSESLARPEDQIVIPDENEVLAPLVATVPTQYIAFYSALYRGCDIDKPRNLAKAVTVE